MKIMPHLESLESTPQAHRLAFADPAFMLRSEVRGIRLQLELLKPDLMQYEAGIEHTVVVFGSARFMSLEKAQHLLQHAQTLADESLIATAQTALRNAHYYEAARLFARMVSQGCTGLPACDRLTICTGGGPGIMEAANRGAQEVGAQSVALNIELAHEQAPNPYVTEGLSFKFHYFAIRKMHFMMRAKALVAFPGGFGTLDELFEILTLVQTRKSQMVPILLYGTAYWKKIVNFEALVEEGTISKADLDCFHFVDEPAQAWTQIKTFHQL